MQIPEFTLIAATNDAPGALILPVLAGEEPQLLAADDYGLDADRLGKLEANGKAGRITRILVGSGADDERVAVLLGIGDARDAESLRRAAGAASRALGKEAAAVLDLADATPEELEAFATGYALGAHKLDRYVDSDDDAPERRSLALVGGGDEAAAALERAAIIAEAVALARDLANTPSNDLVPEDFAQLAVERAGETGLEVEVWDEPRLADEGCGGLVGVGQGSANPPRLVQLRYSPADAADAPHVALVGKGITFDTGGLSLKPPASMVGMKFDMSGAASVLAAMTAIARLGLPVRVSGWCCLAENMPSANSIKPDDVLRMRGGTTVEVTNTDAEGRLVLADGLVLASEAEPDVIIDIATLTGAAIIALGNRTTGVMGNDETWRDRVLAASEVAGEPMWAMPIPEEIGERLESNVADLVNAKPGDRAAGMCFAAAFLERFVGETADGEPIPWVHLDIAGPADNGGGAHGYTPKGATGVPVRTLIETVAALAR